MLNMTFEVPYPRFVRYFDIFVITKFFLQPSTKNQNHIFHISEQLSLPLVT